jgi:hypothetical protein
VLITIDTSGEKLQVTLSGVGWDVAEIPDSDGRKLLAFGDDKTDVLIPLGPQVSKNIGSKLLITRLSSLNGVDLTRKGPDAHGS